MIIAVRRSRVIIKLSVRCYGIEADIRLFRCGQYLAVEGNISGIGDLINREVYNNVSDLYCAV